MDAGLNNYAIEISELEKKYGNVTAVNNISLLVEQGEMFGLVGPDGAGKTTTIRTLCGLINPTSGTAVLLNKNVVEHRSFIQKNIGYLSQKFSLYGDLSVDENIEFFAEIHNIKNYKQRRDELLEFTRLTAFRDRLADQLSGGMKQKLALACSLIHRPKVLFLDEPTTGVDPVSRRDFWKILGELVKGGITIFMTTPYLDEAERCNHVALMSKGKILISDTPETIKKSINKRVLEVVCGEVKIAAEIIKEKLRFDVQTFGDRVNIIIDLDFDFYLILRLLDESKINVTSHRIINPNLENVFIHLIKNTN